MMEEIHKKTWKLERKLENARLSNRICLNHLGEKLLPEIINRAEYIKPAKVINNKQLEPRGVNGKPIGEIVPISNNLTTSTSRVVCSVTIGG